MGYYRTDALMASPLFWRPWPFGSLKRRGYASSCYATFLHRRGRNATHARPQRPRYRLDDAAMSDHAKTLYQLLEVPETASAREITLSYRRLCLEYHPDRVPQHLTRLRAEAEARLREIIEAYAVIGNASKRECYDLSLCQGRKHGPSSATGGTPADHSQAPNTAVHDPSNQTVSQPNVVTDYRAVSAARAALVAAIVTFLGIGSFLIWFAPIVLGIAIWASRTLNKTDRSEGRTSAAWAIGLSGFETACILLAVVVSLIDSWT